MSMDKSRNDSSRDETVSHVRQRVSLVSTPSKRRWTKVDEFVGWEVETVMVLGAGAPVDELGMIWVETGLLSMDLRSL